MGAQNPNSEDPKDGNKSGGEKNAASYDDHLTPAERRYIEQREKLEIERKNGEEITFRKTESEFQSLPWLKEEEEEEVLSQPCASTTTWCC